MNRIRTRLAVLALAAWAAAFAPSPAAAQQAAPAAPDSAAADSAARDRGTAAPAAPRRAPRADWLSDRRPLREGDLLMIVVDERTAATERVSTVATGQRGMRADLNAGLTDDDLRLGPQKSVRSGLANDSRDQGEARRQGDLVAVLSVRVVGFEPGGLARVRGAKTVSVDGRTQQVTLEGLVRPEDVGPGNTVQSGRVADAVIAYDGKKLGPRTGIVGRLLGLLWP